MTPADVHQKLKDILSQDFHIPPEKVTGDATFRGTLGMDSLDAVDLVYLVCKAYGLKPVLHDFRDLHSVQKVCDHIAREVTKKAGAVPA